MARADVDAQLLHDSGQARCLASGELEEQPGQRRGIDDRVLERIPETAPDQVGVERVMAVLDQNRALGEAEEGGAGIAEGGSPHQHGAVDLVPLLRVAVDRRAALDQRVVERERAFEPETLGADLDHQEGSVAGGLDVEGHVLGLIEQGVRGHRVGIDGQLLEPDQRSCSRLEDDP
ncbi:MAG TPA: hypothetical protein VF134_04840 [Candidatus Dormibacteraeota bacterium]